ncbi:cobalamin biosynthesis protein CbiM [Rhodoblastus acidophilus]|uniref:Cobalamin biosynthesis protein CbiM n=1 Tax=Rhodoblastus acidophilus TaxID=1074 RepID=A0A6N8DKW0_RHOAC|nr:cobalamin biosynthesis protein CbiM [Rhodoblastus acidophilus]MCW2272936.1 nickel transport protein [Rhodoblastus acidophilus]MTV29843.1 cobalamin biosynthesis protein CbiM [Rhodoblastus acidophilus]
MKRVFPVCALLLALAAPDPACAHHLKLFLTVEDGALGGYAFFVGGGRPEGSTVIVKDSGGHEIYRGKTDDHGAFRWTPPVAADYAVTVDAGDGHWVEGFLAADRLGAPAATPTPATALPTPSAPKPDASACAQPDSAALASLVEAQVDRAVARQLRPLIESYTLAEGRVRLNDVMGGIGMIVGLAGMGLWGLARRRKASDRD